MGIELGAAAWLSDAGFHLPRGTPDGTGGYDAFGADRSAYRNALASANCCPYRLTVCHPAPRASFLAGRAPRIPHRS